jgi:two-component system, cell cycle sensor histidine kinase and response regulator CckA
VGIRLLVIDDERETLRLVQNLLTDSGYEVVIAAGAESALRVFEELKTPPDLIVTDVVMPGMSGPMLAERLRGLSPGLRVLFMSGYDHSHVVRQYVVRQGFDLIAKPFTARALHAAIKKSLAREQV